MMYDNHKKKVFFITMRSPNNSLKDHAEPRENQEKDKMLGVEVLSLSCRNLGGLLLDIARS